MKAIGIIETVGLVPAISALDTCLKSANVEVKSFNYVSSGIVTFTIEGDVGSVTVAVDAGKAACSNLCDSYNGHVIARPIEDIDVVLKGSIINSSDDNTTLKNVVKNTVDSQKKITNNVNTKKPPEIKKPDNIVEPKKPIKNISKKEAPLKVDIAKVAELKNTEVTLMAKDQNVKGEVDLNPKKMKDNVNGAGSFVDKAREKAKKLVEEAKQKVQEKERILAEQNLKTSTTTVKASVEKPSKSSLKKKTMAQLKDILKIRNIGSSIDMTNMKKDEIIKMIIDLDKD